jgi:hypothetical protein
LSDIKQYLQENQINLEFRNSQGRTALHYLCANDHLLEKELVEAIYYLVSKGASLNIQDNYGKEPMFYLGRDLTGRIVDPGFKKGKFLRRYAELTQSMEA